MKTIARSDFPVGADLGQPSPGKLNSLEEGRPRSPPTGSAGWGAASRGEVEPPRVSPFPYCPDFTSSSAISRSLNFCTFMEGVMGKSSTKKTRLGTL